jgi:phage/plasmid-associated DNA primase
MVFTEFSEPITDEYICLNNGVYDIKNKNLIEHDSELFFINKLDMEYNSKLGMKFVEDLCNDWKIDCDEYKKMLGYCFTSDNNQEKIFVMKGLGGSGKGTSMEILTQLLKGKTIGCDIEDISKGFAPTGIENATTMIDFDFDPDTFYRVSVKKLNKYCDGSDIYVDRKYKQGFYIEGKLKPIICTNELPNLKLNTDNLGYYRRLYVFDFKNQFKEGLNQNFNLKNIIKTDSKCRSEMLNFLISGIHLYKDRDVTKPFFKNQDEMKLQQQAESNPTIEYILDSYEKTNIDPTVKNNDRLSWEEIIRHYTDYAESMNFSPLSKRKLKRLFKQHLNIIDDNLDKLLRVNGKPTRCIMNLKFKNDNNENDFSEHENNL